MNYWMTSETLMRDRQRQLAEAADNYRLARQRRAVGPAPVRARAGWLIVRAGLRLARTPREASDLGVLQAR